MVYTKEVQESIGIETNLKDWSLEVKYAKLVNFDYSVTCCISTSKWDSQNHNYLKINSSETWVKLLSIIRLLQSEYC